MWSGLRAEEAAHTHMKSANSHSHLSLTLSLSLPSAPSSSSSSSFPLPFRPSRSHSHSLGRAHTPAIQPALRRTSRRLARIILGHSNSSTCSSRSLPTLSHPIIRRQAALYAAPRRLARILGQQLHDVRRDRRQQRVQQHVVLLGGCGGGEGVKVVAVNRK